MGDGKTLYLRLGSSAWDMLPSSVDWNWTGYRLFFLVARIDLGRYPKGLFLLGRFSDGMDF